MLNSSFNSMLQVNKVSAIVIEQLANRVLNLDPEANKKLTSFAKKTIHIHISDLNLNYFFLFPGGSIIVLERSEKDTSASISGKLSAFLAAITSKNSSDGIFKGELHFSGEINTARQFQEFVQSLEIDWLEPFSRLFGDIMTQHIAQGFNQLSRFVNQFANNAQHDIPEYLQHEVHATPSHNEVDYFLKQVDITRSQTDRLQARIQRLQANNNVL